MRQPTLPALTLLLTTLTNDCHALAISLTPHLPSPSRILRRDAAPSELFSNQWRNPTDVLSVLLIIGGDIIQKALAQLSGGTIVPVAFSFGWVAYSFSTVMSVVGDGRLMPAPDYLAKVINAESGYKRDNKSWVLGRLLRDYEMPLGDNIGISITVFEAQDNAGVPERDFLWWSGVVVIVLQLGIAAIPCGLHQDWAILLLTAGGILLALTTGALPQWRFEKWACRRETKKVVSLTGGNGTRHVMVIIGNKKGLDLEDLAAAESPRMRRRGEDSDRLAKRVRDEHGKVVKDKEGNHKTEVRMIKGRPAAFWITRTACLTLAALWIVFLISVAGWKQNTWYLLAVGGVGMAHNVVVAGAKRSASTTGIHLKKVERIQQTKVMDALMDLENAYETVGRSLLEEFFPGKFRQAETQWWEGKKDAYDKKRRDERPTSLVQIWRTDEEEEEIESVRARHYKTVHPDPKN